jgi:alcohol dehydrogenase (cytochrome c)
MRLVRFGAAVALGLAIAGGAVALAAAEDSAPSGEQVYRGQCASCHGVQLGGSSGPGVGPALKGRAFAAKWGQSPAGLAAFIHEQMPLNNPGSLDQASAKAVADYVLAAGSKVGVSIVDAVRKNAEPGGGYVMPANDEDKDAAYHAAMDARAALIAKVRPVDDQMLAAPAEEDWLSWRGNRSTQGFSPLKQIDRADVGRLGLAWSLSLPSGTNGIAPIVHDGVMFIHSNGTVQALDARNGDSIWRFSRPATTTRVPSNQPRGIALYGDALYVPTVDNHVLALDTKTGKLLWDHEIGKPADMLQLTAAPIVIHGKVIQGVSGCQGSELPGGCFIVALDAKTGDEAWRFWTVARPDSKEGNSWNGAPLGRRFGGSVWNTGSYDPDLNLFIVGVAQTYTVSSLLDRQKVKGQSNDGLFTDSTVALDPDTGKLVWYYQHEAAEVWDLDWSFERTLATIDGPKGPQRVVITGGKNGIFDALDARTGHYLWSVDMGAQNYVVKIDPVTGRKTHDPKLEPVIGQPKLVCPSTIGNRNWMSTGYDPATRLLYIPMTPTCMDYSRSDPSDDGAYGEMMIVRRRPPSSDGNQGWLAAIDVANRKIAWVKKRRAPQSSAVLTTAGGLIFEGGRDRAFRALDDRSGDVLWQTLLPATPNAYPFSYSVGGVQYVGIVTGGGSAVDAFQAPMTPENPPSNGAKTIMIFALPPKG